MRIINIQLTIKKMKYFFVFISLLVMSCQSMEEPHGHPHDAQGGHNVAGDGVPRVDATIWTDKTELFVEYPALVVGQTSRFAAHVTILDKHRPVVEGTVTVSLIKNGKGIRQTIEAPSSPGIFNPALRPKEVGIHQLVFDIKTPLYDEKIVVGNVPVFATSEEAAEATGHENEVSGKINFLKEQAWKIEFQTTPVVHGEIYNVIHTSGVWKAAPGSFRSIVANTSGVVSFSIDNLTDGTMVKKGQLLMTIGSKGLTSNNLQTEIENAKANYEHAKSEYDRKEQLYQSKIVPKADFEHAENAYRVAKSNYETLKSGYSSGSKQILAPFGGFIKSISIGNGSFVEEGADLIAIGTDQSHLLETHVSPSYAEKLQNIHNIWYQPKAGEWSNMMDSGGFIQSISKEVDHEKPMLNIYAKIHEKIAMPVGSFTEVHIAYGKLEQSLLVPENALLEDFGSFSVIAQLSGETFERRPVKTGKRNGEFVEILSGLKANEFVVSKGAYQVKMASMSGQVPAHGHAH